MSHSDDPTSPTEETPTSTKQEPPKHGFLDSDETSSSLSDVPIQNQTQQDSHQDSSSLRFPGVSPMNLLNSSGTLFNGNQSNSSLGYGYNMGSQRNSGFTMMPTPGTVKSGNNNGKTCLSIEASNNSGRFGTNFTDPSSFQSLSATSSSSLVTTHLKHQSENTDLQSHQQQLMQLKQQEQRFGKSGANNNSGRYGTYITNPFGSSNTDPSNFQSMSATSSTFVFDEQQQQEFLRQSLLLKQQNYRPERFISPDDFVKNQAASYSHTPEPFQLSQFQNLYRNNAGSHILPVTSQMQNMGSGSTNSFSNLSVGMRSESGLHGHSQSQSQELSQISNSMSNTGTYITDHFGSRNTDPASFPFGSVGMMTNTHNTHPSSFQSVSATSSSSLFQQQFLQFLQQQIQQQQEQQQILHQRFQPQRSTSHDAFGQTQVAAYDMVSPFTQTPEQYQHSQFQNQYRNNAQDRQIMSGTDEAQGNLMCRESVTGNLFSGNQSNFPPNYGWSTGHTKPITMMPTPGFSKSNTNNNNYGQSYLSVEAFNNSGGYGTNPASFQPFSTTSSSFPHQQQQFRQHRALTEPQWTTVLTMNDMATKLHLHTLFVEENILVHLSEEGRKKLCDTEPGVMIKVYDNNTNSEHYLHLVLRAKLYFLWKGWKKEFVQRRRLRSEEHIGLFWDPCDNTLHFAVLPPEYPKAPAENKNLSIQ